MLAVNFIAVVQPCKYLHGVHFIFVIEYGYTQIHQFHDSILITVVGSKDKDKKLASKNNYSLNCKVFLRWMVLFGEYIPTVIDVITT